MENQTSEKQTVVTEAQEALSEAIRAAMDATTPLMQLEDSDPKNNYPYGTVLGLAKMLNYINVYIGGPDAPDLFNEWTSVEESTLVLPVIERLVNEDYETDILEKR